MYIVYNMYMCLTRGIIVPIDEHICSDRLFNHHVHTGIFSTQELKDLSRNLDESLERWGNHWQVAEFTPCHTYMICKKNDNYI